MKKWIAALTVTAGVLCARAVDTHHSVEDRIRQHISQIAPNLEQIAIQSLEDQFEHGGVGVCEDGKLVLYEIPNQATRYEEFLQNYLDGKDPGASSFMSLLYAAACINDYNQGGTSQYAQAVWIGAQLPRLRFFPKESRPFLETTKNLARTMLSIVYIADPDLEKTYYATKEVLFEWHTHYHGTPPSKQDLRISKDHIEVIASIPGFNIFLVHGGKSKKAYRKP